MYKVIQLLKRRSDLAAPDFTRAWVGELDCPRPQNLIRHVHNQPVMADSPIANAPAAAFFDGVDELWFAHVGAAADYFAHFYPHHWLAPRARLLADPKPVTISGTPHLLVDNQPAPSAGEEVKLLILPRRRSDMTQAQFVDYWLERHVPLALSGPGTRKRLASLEVCPSADVPLAGTIAAPWDGASAILFQSATALKDEFESDHYRQALAPDEPRFTDPHHSFVLIVRPMVLHGR